MTVTNRVPVGRAALKRRICRRYRNQHSVLKPGLTNYQSPQLLMLHVGAAAAKRTRRPPPARQHRQGSSTATLLRQRLFSALVQGIGRICYRIIDLISEHDLTEFGPLRRPSPRIHCIRCVLGQPGRTSTAKSVQEPSQSGPAEPRTAAEI